MFARTDGFELIPRHMSSRGHYICLWFGVWMSPLTHGGAGAQKGRENSGIQSRERRQTQPHACKISVLRPVAGHSRGKAIAMVWGEAWDRVYPNTDRVCSTPTLPQPVSPSPLLPG